jgi:uracil-DNA glycosylase
MDATDEIGELHAITAALRVYTERLAATGATGLPAASQELIAERAAVAGPELVEAAVASEPRAPVRSALEPQAPVRSAALQPVTIAPVSAKPLASSSEGPAAPSAAPLDLDARKTRLSVLATEVTSCTRCGLHAGRTQTVFARGDGTSGLCFVGEGPGADEDAQGFPFVGKAGQLLDRMIAAMGFERDDVYVANIVKCRPPNNRKPEIDEMAACMPYLAEQLELLDPQVIVALGATAVQGLLGTSEGITRMRGRWRLYKGRIAVMPTFHPAYLLRTPAAKREVWEDLQAVLRQMGRPIPARR